MRAFKNKWISKEGAGFVRAVSRRPSFHIMLFLCYVCTEQSLMNRLTHRWTRRQNNFAQFGIKGTIRVERV